MATGSGIGLCAKGITKRFGGVVALSDARMTVLAGKICGLLGANGSGKTTLLRIMSGIINPSGGELLIDEERVRIDSPLGAFRHGIVMVHQHLSLIPELSVWENMCLGNETVGRLGFHNTTSERNRAIETLERLRFDVPPDEKARDLPPSKRQLAEIAKALLKRPRLLLLDEPTASLGQAEVATLFSVLKDLRRDGTTMVFTSHRMWEVMEVCDAVTVFRNGRTVAEIDFEKQPRDEKKIIMLITGKEYDAQAPHASATRSAGDETIVSVSDLVLPGFADRHAPPINLSIRPGEIVGVSGLHGQGQEELLLVLAGFLRPRRGRIVFDGKPARIRSPRDAVKLGIALVPGNRNEEGLFTQHSIGFNLAYPKLMGRGEPFVIPRRKYQQAARATISKLSILAESESTLVQNLSGGNQQKVVIGKWLDLHPRLLLLSDPAKGVDVQAKSDLYDAVRGLAAEGTAIVLYASDNAELCSICQRVLVMFDGGISEDLSNTDLAEEDLTAHSLRAKQCLDMTGNSQGKVV